MKKDYKSINKLRIGNTIQCSSVDDMIDVMYELEHSNIHTDFMHEKDGEEGFWLVVVK